MFTYERDSPSGVSFGAILVEFWYRRETKKNYIKFVLTSDPAISTTFLKAHAHPFNVDIAKFLEKGSQLTLDVLGMAASHLRHAYQLSNSLSTSYQELFILNHRLSTSTSLSPLAPPPLCTDREFGLLKGMCLFSRLHHTNKTQAPTISRTPAAVKSAPHKSHPAMPLPSMSDVWTSGIHLLLCLGNDPSTIM
jgi:hypothetical protein